MLHHIITNFVRMNNKTLYQDEASNSIRVSEISRFSGEVSFSNVAAKFVIKGEETYIIDNKKFLVKQGEYIIGSNNKLSEVLIKDQAVGLCIDISNDIITEILETLFDNPDLNEFLLTDRFLINKYHSEHTNLGVKLNQLSRTLWSQNKADFLSTELFYSIGEHIVHDQAVVFDQLSKLNYKKQSVSEDVFRNLLNAKYYIDDSFLDPINLDDLVGVAFISKYAFIRLFKITFGITPYHYIIQKRLNYAKHQILKGERVIDVAFATNFADTASFSKAFKAYHGISPSKLK